MQTYFPTSQAITNDAHIIIDALNARTAEIKNTIDSQGIIKRIVLAATKIFGMGAGVVALASIAAAAATFTITPLMIALAATAATVICLVSYILFDPRNAGESIVKDQWKALFDALRSDSGEEIIKKGQDLLYQKDHRPESFEKCIRKLDANSLNPFFHKTCMIGYLLIALNFLHLEEEEKAKSNAHLALSHYIDSNFPSEVEVLAQSIINNPKELILLIHKHHVGRGIHALDHLVNLHSSN